MDTNTSTTHDHKHKKHGFTGQLGFVMAAAGSAVGVGNLWRFPYLAARDGGGLFGGRKDWQELDRRLRLYES